MELFETEEIKELQLTGHHLPSLADLALKQTAQVRQTSHFERGSGWAKERASARSGLCR